MGRLPYTEQEMRLLTGPPGSGKTRRVLERVRCYLAERCWKFRLVAPTATMAEHLRNELAREGYVFRAGVVTTLSQLLARWAPEWAEPTEARLLLAVRQALEITSPPAFERVAGFAGFQSALARSLLELSSAGCHAAALGAVVRNRGLPPHLSALAGVYAEAEAQLARDGFLLRGARLRQAAERLGATGLPDVSEIFFDGFFSFSDPELDLIEALSRHASVTVTLPEWPGSAPARDRLLRCGFQEESLCRVRPHPKVTLVAAAAPDYECNEIARRILAEAAAGRPLREMGVIVRSAGPWAAAVESALVRFGIPVRAYFGRRLADESVIRFFAAVIEALCADWAHEKVLEALILTASGAGRQAGADRFEFDVRARLPARGLDTLRQFARTPRVRGFLDRLETLETWRRQLAPPSEWRARLSRLAEFFWPERPQGEEPHDTALVWRRQAATLEAYQAALEEAASSMPEARPVTLEEFWNAVTAVLEATVLRVRDERRNVVHLLDAYEARQWELPVVFVCGLLEGEFPLHPTPDPMLDEQARAVLNRAGYRVGTASAREDEERLLWDVAVSRATTKLVLSWSRFNAKGEENLRSFFLDEFLSARPADEDAEAVALRPRSLVSPRAPRTVRVADRALQTEIAQRNRTLKPTGIEDFLQCPFLFFARYTLDLEAPPEAPDERVDFAGRGEMAHKFLERWATQKGDFAALFEELFEAWAERQAIPPGYAREAARLELEQNLKRFVPQFSLSGLETVETEKKFRLELGDGLWIEGRIDRVDRDANGRAIVIDYKYVKPYRVSQRIRGHEDGKLVQGGLYLLGARQCLGCSVAGFLLAGVRGKPKWDGWHLGLPGLEKAGVTCTEDVLEELAETARNRALEAFAKIGAGIVAPDPAAPELCEHCTFRDVCRIEVEAPTVAAAAEDSE
ncbi:MAG: PD-(D/E)XK nuclease family protein [Bryobacterales bacterium]|nr:exodeoxyribonuclease V subunit gamma [Bryobacteraceae bacterium]MDW8355494.1 PD-(D/E)XK nuclease family protein [Bryobacterales bacterium]